MWTSREIEIAQSKQDFLYVFTVSVGWSGQDRMCGIIMTQAQINEFGLHLSLWGMSLSHSRCPLWDFSELYRMSHRLQDLRHQLSFFSDITVGWYWSNSGMSLVLKLHGWWLIFHFFSCFFFVLLLYFTWWIFIWNWTRAHILWFLSCALILYSSQINMNTLFAVQICHFTASSSH